MKRVVLLIGGRSPAHASGFVQAYAQLGGRPDVLLLLEPGTRRPALVTAALRPLKALRLGRWKGYAVDLVRRLTGTQRMADLKASWNVPKGESSWALLPPGIDLVAYAQGKGIPVHIRPALTASVIEELCRQGPTVFVLYAGGVIPDALLQVPGAEFVNAHMGAMPRYRGMNVIEWAVLEGAVPKVSVMLMTAAIDGGDVIFEREIPLGGERTLADLRRTGFVHCYRAMAEGVFHYARGLSPAVPQPKGARYYYRMHSVLRQRAQEALNTWTASPVAAQAAS